MNYRLVGAIILGCLAIIFIPIILDGDGIKPPEVLPDIPSKPSMQEVIINKAIRPEILADSNEINITSSNLADESLNPDNPTSLNETNDQTSSLVGELSTGELDDELAIDDLGNDHVGLNEQGLPQAWTVQLGVFGEIENANTLVTRLLDAGYKVYSLQRKSNSGAVLTSVYVGPLVNKKEANELATMLAREYLLSVIVVDYIIE